MTSGQVATKSELLLGLLSEILGVGLLLLLGLFAVLLERVAVGVNWGARVAVETVLGLFLGNGLASLLVLQLRVASVRAP